MTRQLIQRWSWLRAAGAGLARRGGPAHRARRGRPAPVLLGRSPAARAGQPGCLRRSAVGHRSVLRPHLQPVRHAAQGAGGRPRRRTSTPIDEVPDSSWFTNRIGSSRPLTNDELIKGPNSGQAPDPASWTIIREKSCRVRRGLHRQGCVRRHLVRLVRRAGQSGRRDWGAIVVATKLFWALGYNQVEYFLTELDPARIKVASGRHRQASLG